MTEEQMAINRIKCGNTAQSCKADYIQLAIEALEKQVPKKPNRCVGFTELLFVCPSCGRKQSIMYEQYYCKECGQKLDWGNEHDGE